MISMTKGRMVVTPDGRVGMTAGMEEGLMYVQFGAGGPYGCWRRTELRYATAAEVKAAGLEGVGRDETMEK